jgi:hypothetical protein
MFADRQYSADNAVGLAGDFIQRSSNKISVKEDSIRNFLFLFAIKESGII